MNSSPLEPSQNSTPSTLLVVDDEPGILSAFRRLFSTSGYAVLLANSGEEGLAVLAKQPVDLVISDMRMPQMNGAQFLEQVHKHYADTVRILLTGYADTSSTIEAINKGQIYRYISKPWEDQEVLSIVRQALQNKALEREKNRLEALTRQQNKQLKTLNTELESKVQQRTQELSDALQSLEQAHDKLKKSFFTTVRVFSELIEMRAGAMAGHAKRVTDLARNLALHLELSDNEIQDIVIAGLLHDIGKIGLPDNIIEKSVSVMSHQEREEWMKHPARGQAILMALEQLQNVALLIRHHHEHFDGNGFPDKLVGSAIPMGARILAVVNDYDTIVNGSVLNKRLTLETALATLVEGKGHRYDPVVAEAFIELINGGKLETVVIQPARTIVLELGQLREGMVVAEDLHSREGLLLLGKDLVLNERIIEQLKNYQRIDGESMKIGVKS